MKPHLSLLLITILAIATTACSKESNPPTFTVETDTTPQPPIIEDVSTDPIIEDVSTDPIIEDVSTDPIIEDVSTDPIIEDVSTNPMTASLYHPDFFDRFTVQTAEQLWPQETQPMDRFEDDGRLSHRRYRLTPKDNIDYPISFNFIDVGRSFEWHTNGDLINPTESCFIEHPQQGNKRYTIEVCQRVIHTGTKIPVTVHDQIFIQAEPTNTTLIEPLGEWHRVSGIVLLTTERTIRLNRRESIVACVDLNTNQACAIEEPTENDQHLGYSDLPSTVQSLLEEIDVHSNKRRYWQADFQHDDDGLTDIATALLTLTKGHSLDDPAIDLALNYIRAHNYYTYGDTSYQPTAATAEQLHDALLALTQMEGFFGTSKAAAIAHEGYSIAVQGQTFNDFFRDHWLEQHFTIALTMLQHQAQHAPTLNGNWHWGNAIFATLGVIDYTSSQSRSPYVYRFFTAQQQNIRLTLETLGRSELALWRTDAQQLDFFILANVIDALTRIYRLEKFSGHHNAQQSAELLRPELDKTLLKILEHHQLQRSSTTITQDFQEQTSISLATYYATWTDRDGRDFCTAAFANYCQPLDKQALFDETYQCSSSLRLTVRKEAMTQQQKQQVCTTLKTQEDAFHDTMHTQRQPVADDVNTQLEVVIFDSSSDWKTYGGALFNVSTDNGGIYIEGDPSRAGNQARFFAYIAEWASDFEIWNLEHEYIHYLDGRYNLYGPFMHYPENRVTWWAEGLAEYLAHGACFERGLSVIGNDRTPSLESILHLTYNSGPNMVYSWSYSVHRYLNERGLQTQWLDMASALRNPNRGEAMFAYEALLTTLIADYSVDYQHWVDTTLRGSGHSSCAATQGRAGHYHHYHRMH